MRGYTFATPDLDHYGNRGPHACKHVHKTPEAAASCDGIVFGAKGYRVVASVRHRELGQVLAGDPRAAELSADDQAHLAAEVPPVVREARAPARLTGRFHGRSRSISRLRR